MPLADPGISWRRFEQFCRAFVSKLPGVVFCTHYGKPGNRQRGIDLVATMSDGSKVTYQCRQWAKFTGTHVRKTIRETTYPAARHVVLTSAEADVTARDAIEEHAPEWELWDVTDISQKVRGLSPQNAHSIVMVSLGPVWCRAFLRAGAIAAVLPSEVSLAPYLDPNRTFNHTHKLVAQGQALQKLLAFAGSPEERVAIVAGPGGAGKTRLLLELDRRVRGKTPDFQVLRAEEGITIGEATIEQIPYGDCLLIADDAHRRSDLPLLLALLRQRPQMKLLLSTRPHAVQRLENEIRRGKFAAGEIAGSVLVRKLSYEESLELVRSILGDDTDAVHTGQRIARISDGSPLVASIAAALVRDRALLPETIQEDADFAQEVFTKFEDALLGDYTNDPEERRVARAFLPLVAALAPLSISNEVITESIAAHLGVPPSTIRRTAAALEAAGILVRQGDSIRITPDVLADHILTSQSLTSDGQPTGYAVELVRRFGSVSMKALLRSFAELDWRVRHTRDDARSGVEEIWRLFEDRFADADDSVRDTLLEILEDVAYYQPARTLALVKPLILGASPPPKPGGRYPRILERVGYTLEHLRECIELLLLLARGERPDGKGEASQILTKIAAYDLKKPFAVQQIVLDAVEAWLSKGPGGLEVGLGVARHLLAKTGLNTSADERQLFFRPFFVPPDAVVSIRERARRICADALTSSEPSLCYRAAKILCEDVAEPIMTFGQQITQQQRDSWIPERMLTLEVLERAMRSTSDPVLRLVVRDGLIWHARHGSPSEMKKRALNLLDAIPQDFDQRLTRILRGNAMDRMRDVVDVTADTEEFKAEAALIAGEYVKGVPSPVDGCEDIDRRLRRLEAWQSPNAWFFLEALARTSPPYAVAVLRRALEARLGQIVGWIPAMFLHIRVNRPADAQEVLQIAMRSGPEAREALARAIAVCAQTLRDEERAAWEALLRDEHPGVRRSALASLRGLAEIDPRKALELALSASFGEGDGRAGLVDELCSLLHGISDDILDEDSVRAVLNVVASANSLREFWIRRFIARASKRCPVDTARMLIGRMQSEDRRTDRFEALPFDGLAEELGHLRGTPGIGEILQAIVDVAARPARFYHVSQLFADVAPLDMDATRRLLSARLTAGQRSDVELVARLVAELPSEVIMQEVRLIGALLRAAHALGAACLQRVEAALSSALTPDLNQKAEEMARCLPDGSLEQRLFQALATAITRASSNSVAEDPELGD